MCKNLVKATKPKQEKPIAVDYLAECEKTLSKRLDAASASSAESVRAVWSWNTTEKRTPAAVVSFWNV